jgi:malic enzyme
MPAENEKAEEKRAQLRNALLSNTTSSPPPAKSAIAATKQLTNQRDLALAYSPGVAAPCEEIVKRSGCCVQVHQPRQSGGRGDQRHSGARPG